MLTLDREIAVGKPKPITRWSNENQKYEEADAYQEFVDGMTDKEYDWKTKLTTQTLFPVTGDINGSDCYHKNYMSYLERCWGDHLGAVITPDIIWYSLLCELAILIKATPEPYRSLFSTSSEKQEIIVHSDSRVTMPLEALIEKLKDRVPTDTERFLPSFSTSNIKSVHAFHAAFCDMVSPYYNYSMLCCGIPYIDVRGTEEDYAKVRDKWQGLLELFPSKWSSSVHKLLGDIVDNYENASFWKGMFDLERCGSGGDKIVHGWWAQMFRVQPDLAYPHNYSTHVSNVEYKDLPTQMEYVMKVGLLSSNFRDDLLVPEFGHVVYEKRKSESDELKLEIESQEIKRVW